MGRACTQSPPRHTHTQIMRAAPVPWVTGEGSSVVCLWPRCQGSPVLWLFKIHQHHRPQVPQLGSRAGARHTRPSPTAPGHCCCHRRLRARASRPASLEARAAQQSGNVKPSPCFSGRQPSRWHHAGHHCELRPGSAPLLAARCGLASRMGGR